MDLLTDVTTTPWMTVNTTTTDHPHNMEHNLLTSIIATISLSIIIIVSLCANALATSTILRVRLLRENLHNHLIVNLNVVSMFITVFSMPLTLISIFDDGMLLEENKGLCLFNGFSSIAFPVASSFTVLWIAVDRYLTVVWSKRFPPSSLRTILMIVATWVISCVVAILPLFNVLSEYFYMHDTHHCSPVWDMCEFYFVVFFAVYGLSIPIMVISYVFVVYHLCKKERKMQSHHDQSFRSRSRVSQAERSVRRSRRTRAEKPITEQGSSLVVDSSHHSNRDERLEKEKAHHDSGYVSPPKNSLGGTEGPPECDAVLHDAVDALKQEHLNKNNSASTDDGADEPRLSLRVRQGSVRDMVKRLEKNNKKPKSKYDSLPRARRKRHAVSNDLRKAASANDVLDYETPLTDIYTSKDYYGSPRNTSMESDQEDVLSQGDSAEMQRVFLPESFPCETVSSPPIYHCYEENDTTVVVGVITDGDTEADACSLESKLLPKENTEYIHHIVPNIIIEDVSGGDSLQESDEESSDAHNSSSFSSQNDESQSTLLTATVDQGLLAISNNTSGVDSEEAEKSPHADRHIDDEAHLPVLQFCLSVESLAASDKENSFLDESQRKRAASIGSISSTLRQLSGSSGTEVSKLKRGSTRRPSMRPALTADKQVARMGGLLVLTAVICWTPYFVVHSCFFPMEVAPHWSSILTMWLGYLNAMLNPLIYSFTNRRIRSMVGTFCGKRCKRVRALLCRKRTKSVTP